MTFRSHPQGLRMLVPEGNIEIALRRQSRGVHVRDLVLLAKGAARLAAVLDAGQNRDGTSCGCVPGSR